MSNDNPKVRYVIRSGYVQFCVMMQELMSRNNSGRTEPAYMLSGSPAIMSGHLGMRFQLHAQYNGRVAWMVATEDAMEWLVWMGTDSLDDTKDDGQGNLIPKSEKMKSARYLDVKNAFFNVEAYLLCGTSPIHHIPAGHLATLTG
jgi:hypothetical protein